MTDIDDYITLDEEREYTIDPENGWFRLACCSCHLVHDIFFRIESGNIVINIQTNEEETQKLREAHGIEGILVNGKIEV